MKKFLLTASLLVLIASFSNISAQKKNLVKFNFVSAAFKTANFQLEHGIGRSSLQLGFFYTGYEVLDTRFMGYAITPEYRRYFGHDTGSPEGLFLAPFLRYQNFSLSYHGSGNVEKASFYSYRPGLCVGYQKILMNIISLELFLGPSYSFSTINVKYGEENNFNLDAFDGFGFRAGMTVGVAF